MKTFKCYECRHIFEAKGKKTEYTDAIYGPCSKWLATCPECGSDAGQFESKPGRSKASGAAPCGKYDSCNCCGG